MSTKLDYNDCTVAWLGVLPIEAEAALGVLDKRHEGHFESERGDDYIYIGEYGVGSAAALESQVKARFPRIWFALLVGVAAGLPNLSPSDPAKYRDIRLGDVIVGVPDGTGGGIVHYDLGKATDEGFFPTNRLAETPAIVRAAIGHIQLPRRDLSRLEIN
ncbi:hypothetical protein A1O7_06873 [Cladophialophora yegresii CBS 114405]|uniref:Nucleoside phosphorylase domain-containing protein n=1 Tax=Cladophialophora yegresii CBS 114405 TaxID=1182544 RepID=W9WDC5_9EURO|nr:uncharacterized protein A1O7_06873 [Cladophialophora yegresii CBS 114405]EXJ56529.1 hypothetical protein A1O7_06873 [Cladophialophora yegresii CBS 114405]